MQHKIIKNRLKMQKQTTIDIEKKLGNINGQVNHCCLDKELDRQQKC